MSLASLIRKKPSMAVAPAIPVMTVASSKFCEQETTCYRWMVHFADRDPLEVAFSPEASHGDVLAFYPAALAAEPADLATRLPAASEALIGDGSSLAIPDKGNANRVFPLDTQTS